MENSLRAKEQKINNSINAKIAKIITAQMLEMNGFTFRLKPISISKINECFFLSDPNWMKIK